MLGHDPHGLGGRVAGEHLGLGQPGADEARALGVGLRVGDDGLDLGELELGAGDQAVSDRMHDLAEDRDVLGLHRQRIERRVDRAAERVLDRHQGSLDDAVMDRHHRLVDRRQRDELEPVRSAPSVASISASSLNVPSGTEITDDHRCHRARSAAG